MKTNPLCKVCKRPIEAHRRGRGVHPPDTCADCVWAQRDAAKSRRVLLREQLSVYRGRQTP